MKFEVEINMGDGSTCVSAGVIPKIKRDAKGKTKYDIEYVPKISFTKLKKKMKVGATLSTKDKIAAGAEVTICFANKEALAVLEKVVAHTKKIFLKQKKKK